jgi:hypothetical protein
MPLLSVSSYDTKFEKLESWNAGISWLSEQPGYLFSGDNLFVNYSEACIFF